MHLKQGVRCFAVRTVGVCSVNSDEIADSDAEVLLILGFFLSPLWFMRPPHQSCPACLPGLACLFGLVNFWTVGENMSCLRQFEGNFEVVGLGKVTFRSC